MKTLSNRTSSGTLPWGLTIRFQRQCHSATHIWSTSGFPTQLTVPAAAVRGADLTQPLLKNFWIDQHAADDPPGQKPVQIRRAGIAPADHHVRHRRRKCLLRTHLRAGKREGAAGGARSRPDPAGPGPAARADRHAGATGRAAGRGAGGHEPGQSDCRAIHAGHGSKHPEKSAHRRVFTLARYGHSTHGDDYQCAAAVVRFAGQLEQGHDRAARPNAVPVERGSSRAFS